MAVTEEIDALRVMGLNPVEFRLAPKYLGALITVPCLTVLSTLCGVSAGYLFLWSSIHMSLRVYVREVVDAILLRDVWLTLTKSVVFATIVVQVGCTEGSRARGGPEAVGAAATRAVVKATFFVIVADLVASAMFYVMGWSAASMTQFTTSAQEAVISIRGLSASYGDRRVLHGVDLDMYRGEIFVLLGGADRERRRC